MTQNTPAPLPGPPARPPNAAWSCTWCTRPTCPASPASCLSRPSTPPAGTRPQPSLQITSEISELSPAETLVALSRDAQLVVTGTTRTIAAIRAEFPDVPVSVDVVSGNAVPTLIDAARGARLLVVGAHRHHGPLSVGAGYVVQGLLAHSQTPVGVVPIH